MTVELLHVPRDQLSLLVTWLYAGAPIARRVVDWDGAPRFYWDMETEHHEGVLAWGSATPARDLRTFLERTRAHLSGLPRAAASMGLVQGDRPENCFARFYSGWERTWLALRDLVDATADRDALLQASLALHPTGDRAWLALVLVGIGEPELARHHASSVTAPADQTWMRWLVEGRTGAVLAEALEPGRYAPTHGSRAALHAALRGEWRGVLAAVPAHAETPFARLRRWGPNRLLAKLAMRQLGEPLDEVELRGQLEGFLGHTGVFGTEVPSGVSLSATSVAPYAELYRSNFEPSLSPMEVYPRIVAMAGFTGSTPRVHFVHTEVMATLATILDWLVTLPEDASVSVSSKGAMTATLVASA